MIFLFPRWDMLIPWRVIPLNGQVLSRWSQGLGLLVRRKIHGGIWTQVFHSYGWHSENSGKHPPKSSTLMGFSMIFTIHFGGPPLFLETPIYPSLKRAMRLGSFQKLGNHQSTVFLEGKWERVKNADMSWFTRWWTKWQLKPLCFFFVFFLIICPLFRCLFCHLSC